MVTNVVFSLLFVFCLVGMLEYRNRALKAESYARNTAKLYHQYKAAITNWQSYATSLEIRIAEFDDQSAMLRKIYHAAYDTLKDNVSRLSTQVAQSKAAASNGNSKEKSQDTPKTPATQGNTLADLGTITAYEQSKIDNWRKSGTNDAECAKRVANMRKSQTTKQAA